MKKLRTNQYYDWCLNFHTLYQERLSRNTFIHRERTKVNPIINTYIYILSRRYSIQGGNDRFSEHFAVALLDCERASFCVSTIIKIVNNNTNDKQTSGISGVRWN